MGASLSSLSPGGGAGLADFMQAAHALRSEAAPEGDAGAAAAWWARVIPAAEMRAADLFAVIQPEHVREMRAANPRNLALLVVKVRRPEHEGHTHTA
jgi:hypothetical protein